MIVINIVGVSFTVNSSNYFLSKTIQHEVKKTRLHILNESGKVINNWVLNIDCNLRSTKFSFIEDLNFITPKQGELI